MIMNAKEIAEMALTKRADDNDVMTGLPGYATNLLTGGTLGGLRAAQVKGRALERGKKKEDLPFTVRHPFLGPIASTAGGLGAGAIGGSLLGAGVGALAGAPAVGATAGAGIGELLGGLAGSALPQYRAGQVQDDLKKKKTEKKSASFAKQAWQFHLPFQHTQQLQQPQISPQQREFDASPAYSGPASSQQGEAGYQRMLSYLRREHPEAVGALESNPQRINELEQSVAGAIRTDPRMAGALESHPGQMFPGADLSSVRQAVGQINGAVGQDPEARVAGARAYVNELMRSGDPNAKMMAIAYIKHLQTDPSMAQALASAPQAPAQHVPPPQIPQQQMAGHPWQLQEASNLVNKSPVFAGPVAQPHPWQLHEAGNLVNQSPAFAGPSAPPPRQIAQAALPTPQAHQQLAMRAPASNPYK